VKKQTYHFNAGVRQPWTTGDAARQRMRAWRWSWSDATQRPWAARRWSLGSGAGGGGGGA